MNSIVNTFIILYQYLLWYIRLKCSSDFSKSATSFILRRFHDGNTTLLIASREERIATEFSTGMTFKYNSGHYNSGQKEFSKVQSNGNIFRIFNEYIFLLPQGTIIQLDFYLKNITKRRIKYTETNNTVQ